MAVARTDAKSVLLTKAPASLPAKSSPLPGEVAVQASLVDQAVKDINRMYITKGLETARAIGEYVLRTFFAGSADYFRRRGARHVSFRKLAERDDLHVSHVFLWQCVTLLDQLKALPGEVANALPFSHHKLLLPVRDEKAKVALARKVVRENLTKRQLAVEVRHLRKPGSNGGTRRGRPPVPPIMRVLSLLGRVAAEAAPHVAKADLDHLDGDRMRALVHEAEKHIGVLQGLVGRLRAKIETTTPDLGHGSI